MQRSVYIVLIFFMLLSGIANLGFMAVPNTASATDLEDGDILLSPSSSMTLQEAIDSIAAGKTIYLEGGTYSYSSTIIIDENNIGTTSDFKTIAAYGDEQPVLDFSNMSFDSSNRGIVLAGNYWKIKSIKIQEAGDNGMLLAGHHNVIDNCEFYANRDTGLQLSRYNSSYDEISEWPSHNTIQDCYSHSNYDPDNGEDADGFAAKLTCGEGNEFIRCVADYNVDDGWDLYTKTDTGKIGSVYFEDCEASNNGMTELGQTTEDSDGNGFKLGGSGIAVDHKLVGCTANDNKKHGFTANSNPGDLTLSNCDASGNGGDDFKDVTNSDESDSDESDSDELDNDESDSDESDSDESGSDELDSDESDSDASDSDQSDSDESPETTSCDMSELLAFPCAEGYGKTTTGGRGGNVYEVTNLNDSGSGSFAEAVSQENTTVVFRVSGTIEGNVSVADNVTIAGQTAPGDGIALAGNMAVKGSNVIIRYIRTRLKDNNDSDAIGGRGKSNIMLDHVSASWSTDEVMSFYHNDNVTIQWSMITEACPKDASDDHRFGGIWGNNFSTYHHNLIAHNESRNPRWASAAGYNDYRNNVIYNWGYQSSYGGENAQDGQDSGSWINMIANYYKPGPGTESTARDRIVQPSSREDGDEGHWYVLGNFVVGSESVTNDNWEGVDGSNYIKLDESWDAMPINEQTAEQAYEAVLADVGCTMPNRDSLDARIIEEVRTGTAAFGNNGFIDNPNDAGGYPTLNSTEAPVDSDHDGMPDDWETENGLDPNNTEDRNQTWGPGYTMLEKYLNSLDSF